MPVERRPRRAALSFGGYRFITQVISWTVTVAVARILRPEDYGLMALASLVTGYVEVFSELGLGAAIVQRGEITQRDLSSHFWFSVLVGTVLGVLTIPLAYATAWAVHDPRVIPITESISVLFLFGGFTVVPFNLLLREMRFGAIGASQLVGATVASLSMLWFASHGFGVWTLILGTLLLRLTTMVMVFVLSGWRPSFHFSSAEVRLSLRFGVHVAASRSIFYIFQKADKFIVGKVLGAGALGYYSFALDLASAPNDRMVTAANQVSFPVFARHQTQPDRLQDLFLKISRYIAWVAFPLYLGGAAFGHLLIPILGIKWAPAISLFRWFCLSYLLISVTSLNSGLHNALGRSRVVLIFSLLSIGVMAPCILVAAHFGLAALALPWLLVYPVLLAFWTHKTLKLASIPVGKYLAIYRTPLLASTIMILGVLSARLLPSYSSAFGGAGRETMLVTVVMATVLYAASLFVLERRAIVELWKRRKSRRLTKEIPTS